MIGLIMSLEHLLKGHIHSIHQTQKQILEIRNLSIFPEAKDPVCLWLLITIPVPMTLVQLSLLPFLWRSKHVESSIFMYVFWSTDIQNDCSLLP